MPAKHAKKERIAPRNLALTKDSGLRRLTKRGSMDDTAGKAHNARDLLAERAERLARAAIDPGVSAGRHGRMCAFAGLKRWV